MRRDRRARRGRTWEAAVQVSNESGKEQPWRKWLPKDAVPCDEKPWIGWKPDPNNELAKPWIDWAKTGGVKGVGPSGNAGGLKPKSQDEGPGTEKTMGHAWLSTFPN